MTKPILLFLSIVFVTIVSCQNNTHTTQTINNEPCNFHVQDSSWVITINNGKGSDARLNDFISGPEKIESYIEFVQQVDPELAYSIKYDSLFAKQVCADSLVIDSIGKWENYDVFYISNEFVMLRFLILKDCTGRMRLLYTESDHVGSPYSGTNIFDEKTGATLSRADLHKLFKPSLVSVSGETKLVLKHYVGGNKEYMDEITWKLNPTTNIPEKE